MRARSVGETSTIMISCTSVIDGINPQQTTCDEQNEYTIDLDTLSIDVPPSRNVVTVTPSISVEMAYPTYATMVKEGSNPGVSDPIVLMAGCINAVLTEDERIETKDETEESMYEFVGNMTANQLKEMTDFLENMPSLKHNAKFECTKCGSKNTVELKGLSDFF